MAQAPIFPTNRPLHPPINRRKIAIPVPKKLQACRYWAFGTGCPNVDTSGVNCCQYAHWNARELASHFDQPGTCINWLRHGHCLQQDRCAYEHRHTGVLGLFQEPVTLVGLDLKIADALASTGFNTWDHVALFKLIWAIKRIMPRQNGPGPPPRHPVYPNRFRPSGVGDNTRQNRKRKASSVKSSVEFQLGFHVIPPLMRKGGAGDPITIDSDSEDGQENNTTHRRSKRQKTSNTKKSRAIPTTNITNNTVTQGRQSNFLTVSQNRKENIPHRPSSKVNVAPITKPSLKPVTAQSQSTISERALEFNTDLEIIKDLRNVGDSMSQMQKTMNVLLADMKNSYERHKARFNDDKCMETLNLLGKCMNTAYDCSEVGIKLTDNAIEWILSTQDRNRS